MTLARLPFLDAIAALRHSSLVALCDGMGCALVTLLVGPTGVDPELGERHRSPHLRPRTPSIALSPAEYAQPASGCGCIEKEI